jgi:endogenous inhibitor of DNA gyrase (YacG/DUF329 family)
VLSTDENFPFCSNRCRLIDLGKWASGGYVISSAVTDPAEFESVLFEDSRNRKSEDDQE